MSRYRRIVAAASAVIALAAAPAAAVAQTPAYSEPYRPQFHFTPAQNWMNDPNGMVYYQGEYHLFFQYNPFGDTWGHMSWGHAVSKDLVHWKELPVAIPELGDEMVFSGSAVVDYGNTSGFGTTENPPMVAIYTAAKPGNQSQALAYSTDKGRTWTRYAGQPGAGHRLGRVPRPEGVLVRAREQVGDGGRDGRRAQGPALQLART